MIMFGENWEYLGCSYNLPKVHKELYERLSSDSDIDIYSIFPNLFQMGDCAKYMNAEGYIIEGYQLMKKKAEKEVQYWLKFHKYKTLR